MVVAKDTLKQHKQENIKDVSQIDDDDKISRKSSASYIQNSIRPRVQEEIALTLDELLKKIEGIITENIKKIEKKKGCIGLANWSELPKFEFADKEYTEMCELIWKLKLQAE